MKELLILEKSNYKVESTSEENKYILEGIFTEFDTKNRNGRIYTQKEFMPHFEAMRSVVQKGECLGELDHPKQFETSLKNVSHIVEKVWYDKDSNTIKGRIRLLDTDMGKQAKALVDAGVPLHISSRAAGSVTENKTVKIHKLFTYDLVDTPGFASAKMNCVNESYGFTPINENSTVLMYDVNKDVSEFKEEDKNNDTILNNKTNDNNMDKINESDFRKYSDYTESEINAMKDELLKIKSIQESIISQNDEMVDEFNKVDFSVFENLNEKLESIEKWADHVVEEFNVVKNATPINEGEHLENEKLKELDTKLKALENWSDEVTENINAIKNWSDEVTETVTGIENWSDEVTETVTALEKWSDHSTETVTNLEESLQEGLKPENKEVQNNKTINESEDFDSFKNNIFRQIEKIVTKQPGSESLNENSQSTESVKELPIWLEKIPSKYKESWENLTEGEQTKIYNRAGLREFKTSRAITEFWNNQFTKENVIKQEAPKMLTESQLSEKRQAIIDNYRKQFGK